MSTTFELIDRCRCCGSDRLVEVLDLGDQPPANSLRLPAEPRPSRIPLSVVFCDACATCQLTATVNPTELFSDYVWVTGTASTTRAFSEVFCREVLNRWHSDQDKQSKEPGLVVEVASNDGTFLEPAEPLPRAYRLFASSSVPGQLSASVVPPAMPMLSSHAM